MLAANRIAHRMGLNVGEPFGSGVYPGLPDVFQHLSPSHIQYVIEALGKIGPTYSRLHLIGGGDRVMGHEYIPVQLLDIRLYG